MMSSFAPAQGCACIFAHMYSTFGILSSSIHTEVRYTEPLSYCTLAFVWLSGGLIYILEANLSPTTPWISITVWTIDEIWSTSFLPTLLLFLLYIIYLAEATLTMFESRET